MPNQRILDPEPRVTNIKGAHLKPWIWRPESDLPMCPASNAFSVESSRFPRKSMQPRLGAHPRTQQAAEGVHAIAAFFDGHSTA